MTPLEHQQIAEVNALWRNMNTPKDIESKREAEKEYLAVTEEQGKGFDWGWDAAVAYLSKPGAMRFFANESITKENDALKKRIAELERDALRLKWMAENHGRVEYFDEKREFLVEYADPDSREFDYINGPIVQHDWKGAIDAAMEAK